MALQPEQKRFAPAHMTPLFPETKIGFNALYFFSERASRAHMVPHRVTTALKNFGQNLTNYKKYITILKKPFFIFYKKKIFPHYNYNIIFLYYQVYTHFFSPTFLPLLARSSYAINYKANELPLPHIFP